MSKHNICHSCAEKHSLPYPESKNSVLLDTGSCHFCNYFGDVYDHQLISFFLSKGLTEDVIYNKLFRLRCSYSPKDKANHLNYSLLSKTGFCSELKMEECKTMFLNVLTELDWVEFLLEINKLEKS